MLVREAGVLDGVLHFISEGSIKSREVASAMFRNAAANSWEYHLGFEKIVTQVAAILIEDQDVIIHLPITIPPSYFLIPYRNVFVSFVSKLLCLTDKAVTAVI